MRNCFELNNNTIVGFTTKEIYDAHLVESGLRERREKRGGAQQFTKLTSHIAFHIPGAVSTLQTVPKKWRSPELFSKSN